MAQVHQSTIEMILRARDETKAAFESSQANMHTFMQTGLRAATAARIATAGVEAITAAIRISKGDWDAVHETMQRMPLGIGAFHTALLALKETYTGAAAAAAAFAEKVEHGVQWQAQLVKTLESMRTLAAQNAAAEAGGFEGQRQKADEEARLKREAFLKEAREKGRLTTTTPIMGPPVLSHRDLRTGEWVTTSEQVGEKVTPLPALPPDIKKQLAELDREHRLKLRDIAIAERQEFEAKRTGAEQAAAQQKEQAGRIQERAAEEARRQAEAVQGFRDQALLAQKYGDELALAQIDVRYEKEREAWKDHADVLAALQDAWAEDRARVQRRIQDEAEWATGAAWRPRANRSASRAAFPAGPRRVRCWRRVFSRPAARPRPARARGTWPRSPRRSPTWTIGTAAATA
jgi:hypothetical protein